MRIACVWFEQETDVSKIAEGFVRLSPQIGVRSGRAIFVEIGKCRRLYSEDSFRLRAQVILRRFGAVGAIGIGDGIPQALIAAKYGDAPKPLEALYDYAYPFGASAKEEDGVRLIGKMIENFRLLGVRDLAGFCAIPASQLPSRFGALGLYCRQRIEDGSRVAWPHWAPPEVIEEKIELSHEDFCESIEPLLFHSRTLLDRIFARLKGRGVRLTALKLEVALERFSTVNKPVRVWNFDFMLPHSSAQAVLPVIRERLQRDVDRQPFESLALSIRYEVTETTHGYDAQRNFFHSQDEQQERLNSAIEHLAEGLGKGRVFKAVTKEERLPEKSWKKQEGRKARTDESAPYNERSVSLDGRIPQRPTRLLPKPFKIELNGEKLLLQKREFVIRSWSRVERISSGWLDELQTRSYFKVEVEEGPALWVFKDRDSYYLHGYFE